MTDRGSDPVFQPQFAEALLRAPSRTAYTAVSKRPAMRLGALLGLLPLVDLWLFDVKETDSRLHEQFTGKPNALILANLRQLHAEALRSCSAVR